MRHGFLCLALPRHPDTQDTQDPGHRTVYELVYSDSTVINSQLLSSPDSRARSPVLLFSSFFLFGNRRP